MLKEYFQYEFSVHFSNYLSLLLLFFSISVLLFIIVLHNTTITELPPLLGNQFEVVAVGYVISTTSIISKNVL